MAVKELLKETYNYVGQNYGIDPIKDFPQLLGEDSIFESYISSLEEGLSAKDAAIFRTLATNLRESLLKENLMYNYTPYQTLVFPLLRIFFPRLVAKEAVTVKPMDKPTQVLAFFKAHIVNPLLGIDKDILDSSSTFSAIAYTANIDVANTTTPANLFDLAGAPAEIKNRAVGIERNVILTGFSDGTTTLPEEVVVNPNDGTFTATLDFGGNTDRIFGRVDFQTGEIDFKVENDVVKTFNVNFTVNLEGNDIQSEVELKLETINLTAKRRSLRVKWSPELEQDAQALFDLDVQAELVNLLGQRVAMDIDKEIINDLIFYANAYGQNQLTFSKNPPTGFAFGPKQWYENFITHLNEASSTIYSKTNIGPGNVVLMNPLDAQIVQSLDIYSVEGFYSGDMDINVQGLSVGTLNGKYKIVTTTLVPQGKTIVVLKPEDERAATYVYAPYIPATIVPLPYGNIYNLTLMTRYAKATIRPEGIYVINIT